MGQSFKLITENQMNADLALKHRLYVSQRDFCLSEYLKDIRSGYDIDSSIVIHKVNNIPVGVAIFSPDTYCNIQVFVKKSMRKQGIGGLLINALNPPVGSRCGRGNKASIAFWQSRQSFKYV